MIDWSIDFLKTASGASQVYDIDYTSALLGQNVDQDESNATQPQEEEVHKHILLCIWKFFF